MGAPGWPRGRGVPWRLALSLVWPALVAPIGCRPTEAPEPPAVVRYEAAARRLEAALDDALVASAGPDCAAGCNRLRELAIRTEELCAAIGPSPTDTGPCDDAQTRLREHRQEVSRHCVCLW